jgi:hypothetical protein
VDVPADLLSHVTQLAASIGVDTDVLHVPLLALARDLRVAVPSYRGLQLTVVHSGQPVTMTDMVAVEADGIVLTSLRVPLIAVDSAYDPDSRVIFYAAKRGALVDMAADLAFVLKTSVLTKSHQLVSNGDARAQPGHLQTGRVLVLDADVPAARAASGLFGLSEFSAVNRAVGIMIDGGHNPDHAYEELRREATTAGVEVHVFAARMLGR